MEGRSGGAVAEGFRVGFEPGVDFACDSFEGSEASVEFYGSEVAGMRREDVREGFSFSWGE